MHIFGVLDAPSGPLSFVVVLTRPLAAPFALCADGLLAAAVAAYLLGAHRHREWRSGGEGDAAADAWPVWPAVAFLGGALLLFAAVGSGLARYQDRPSVLVVQHVFLMMAAPPLLVAGRPLRAWVAACRGPTPAEELATVATTAAAPRAVRVLHAVQGVASWPLYYGSMAVFFLTPLLGASVRDPALLDLVECWFVAVGLVFFSGFAGRARSGALRGYGFRVVALLAGAPLETAVGIALMLWPRPVIAGTALGATHSAGLALWIASMVASGAVLGAVLVQWVLEDARRGAEIDLLLDAGMASTDAGMASTAAGMASTAAGMASTAAGMALPVRPSGSGADGGRTRP